MLTPTKVMSNVITGFTTGADVHKRDSDDTVIISTTHLNLSVAQARAYLVTRSGFVTPIAQSESSGKDNSASTLIFNDGTLWLVVSEADPGGSGTTNKIDIYEYAGAFPAVTPPSGTVDQTARNIANQALSLANTIRTTVNNLLNVLKSIINIPNIP